MSRRFRFAILPAAFLLISVTGCGIDAASTPTVTSTPTETAIPTDTPTPTVTRTPTVTPTPLPPLDSVSAASYLNGLLETFHGVTETRVKLLEVTFRTETDQPADYTEILVTAQCYEGPCGEREAFYWIVPSLPGLFDVEKSLQADAPIELHTWHLVVLDADEKRIEEERGPWADLMEYAGRRMSWDELWAGITVLQ
jgi:hypothetical protein